MAVMAILRGFHSFQEYMDGKTIYFCIHFLHLFVLSVLLFYGQPIGSKLSQTGMCIGGIFFLEPVSRTAG